jgi:hypothetical protein
MPTARPFAYNPVTQILGTRIPGTEQVGDLAIGAPTSGFTDSPQFWNGPDEELGYVIAHPVPDNTQPTPLPGVFASVGFFRTNGFNDSEFVELANNITHGSFNYTTALEASLGLTSQGYWNSYTFPVLSLDAGNPLSYVENSTTWTDLIGRKVFHLNFTPSYDSTHGSIKFTAQQGEFAECSSSLPDLNRWSINVWHYYQGSEIGGAPCIVTEVFPGNTGQINYSLGYNTTTGYLNTGFYDGNWQISGGYVLLPDKWYNIVGTYDGYSITLYINGVLVITNPGVIANPMSSQGGIRLMKRWDNYDYWGGKLSTVNIYDKALNQSQITSYFNLTKSRYGL